MYLSFCAPGINSHLLLFRIMHTVLSVHANSVVDTLRNCQNNFLTTFLPIPEHRPRDSLFFTFVSPLTLDLVRAMSLIHTSAHLAGVLEIIM